MSADTQTPNLLGLANLNLQGFESLGLIGVYNSILEALKRTDRTDLDYENIRAVLTTLENLDKLHREHPGDFRFIQPVARIMQGALANNVSIVDRHTYDIKGALAGMGERLTENAAFPAQGADFDMRQFMRIGYHDPKKRVSRTAFPHPNGFHIQLFDQDMYTGLQIQAVHNGSPLVFATRARASQDFRIIGNVLPCSFDDAINADVGEFVTYLKQPPK